MVLQNLHRDGWGLLPHDILLWINSYLDHEDSYACLHVCRKWYSVFCRQFYTTAAILNVQQCIRLSSHFDTVGDGIRNLQLKLSTDDIEAWRRLSQWPFPALRSLSVSVFDKPHFQHTATSCGTISSVPNRNEFRYTIISFVSRQPLLTSLDLCVPHLHNALVLSLLKKLRGLLTLELRGMSGYLTCADMDSIHQSCPELRHIKISAEQFITQGRTLGRIRNQQEPQADDRMHQDVAERGEVEPLPQNDQEDLLLRLFPLDTLPQPAAPKLVSLHISIYRGLEEHMCDWFVYASRNYPHLESFSLEARPENQCRVGERQFEFDLLNMIMDYRWANEVWKHADLAAFQLFVRTCTQVKSLSIMQLYLTRNFLDTIFTCNLPITSFGSTMNICSPWQPEPRNWLFSSTLVSLTLQACVTYPATNTMFMTFLGTMPCLSHLKLSRYEEFDMTTLLQHCTQLQTLSLEHMAILPSDLPAVLNKPPDLHTIELRHVVLNETFFKSIPKGLRSLSLKDAAIIASETKSSKMSVPGIDLESLILSNLLVGDRSSKLTTVKLNSSQRFAVFGVETSTLPCLWYDLCNQGNRHKSTVADERILGIRPLSGKYADEVSKGKHGHGLHILCGSAKKIHINGKRLLDLPVL